MPKRLVITHEFLPGVWVLADIPETNWLSFWTGREAKR